MHLQSRLSCTNPKVCFFVTLLVLQQVVLLNVHNKKHQHLTQDTRIQLIITYLWCFCWCYRLCLRLLDKKNLFHLELTCFYDYYLNLEGCTKYNYCTIYTLALIQLLLRSVSSIYVWNINWFLSFDDVIIATIDHTW